MKYSAKYSKPYDGIVWKVLLIVFVILKITSVINWSWLWVLSPLWIPWLIFGVLLIVIFLYNYCSGHRNTSRKTRRIKW